jgi:nucleotide-binding universal stress UspA family protein
MRLGRLLVPHDFSPHADRALRFAASLAGPAGEVLVLHAVVPVVPIADFGPGIAFQVPIEDLVTGARQGLERRVARLVGRHGPKTIVKVAVGDPYGRIIENVRGRDAIVMSTMGRTGLPHLVIGSVAEKVVRHSPIPVLTLRPAVSRRATRKRTRRASRHG